MNRFGWRSFTKELGPVVTRVVAIAALATSVSVGILVAGDVEGAKGESSLGASSSSLPGFVSTCTSPGLTIRVAGRTAGADSAYTAFSLTNRTRQTCELDGYPEIHAVLSTGQTARISVLRAISPVPKAVVISPGRRAYFTLQTHGGGSQCLTAKALRLSLTDDATGKTIHFPVTICDRVVTVSALTAHQVLEIS